MNIMLVIVGLIFAGCIFLGYRKGFFRLAVSLGIVMLGVAVVFAVSPALSSWLQKSTSLSDKVQKKVEKMLLPEGESKEIFESADASREEQISLIEEGDIPEVLRERLLSNNNSEVYETLGVTTFTEYIGAYIAKILADIIAFLIILVAMLIAIRILVGMAGFMNKIPVVGGINKLAGVALGVGIGIALVWILFIVVTMLYNTSIGKMCLENIASDQSLTALYNKNILMNYIIKF